MVFIIDSCYRVGTLSQRYNQPEQLKAILLLASWQIEGLWSEDSASALAIEPAAEEDIIIRDKASLSLKEEYLRFPKLWTVTIGVLSSVLQRLNSSGRV